MYQSQFSHLKPLFSPKSIAILGASPEPGKPISTFISNILKHNFKGNIYPVNPKYDNVLGLKCFKSIHDIPGPIDTVAIAVRNTDVPNALQDCAKKGVKSATVFSAGFAEIGESRAQEEIRKIAENSGMQILGPNCNGIMNIGDNAIMSFFFQPDIEEIIPGEMSLVSQSGTIALFSVARAFERGIGYRYLVSVGNEAHLDMSDVIGYFAEDEKTKAITGYVEGIRDVKKFLKSADAALQKKKPIILLHATRHESSLTAARYHTNAYTEPGYDYADIFREKGIITVDEPDELIEFGTLFSYCNMPLGDRVGILNTTGGVTVLSADVSSELGLKTPKLSSKTCDFLKGIMKFGTPNNPLDLTGQVAGDPELYGAVFDSFLEDENFDVMIVSMFTLRKEHLKYRIEHLIKRLNSRKPIIVVWPGGELTGDLEKLLIRARVPVFGSIRSCLKGAKALIEYSKFVNQNSI